MQRQADGEGSGSIAMELVVSGRVQGVGFRHFVAVHARQAEVSGWVRNLPDGRVALHAEGSAASLQQLHDSIRKGPPGSRVSAVERSDLAATGSFVGFEIRF